MNKQFPQRKSSRMRKYDYSKSGAYIVTICTKDRKCLFSPVGADMESAPTVSEIVQLIHCIGKKIVFTINKIEVISWHWNRLS